PRTSSRRRGRRCSTRSSTACCAVACAPMAQPDYVPVAPADKVRPAERLPPARAWTTSRPGEITGLRLPAGRRFGVPGPDQGYALTLAARSAEQLELGKGESRGDVVAGCVGVAMKRAALFGRAPVVFDLELA